MTENYGRLQGLRRMPLALCVTALGLAVYLDENSVYTVAALVFIFPAVFAEETVGRLYERRFGRVRSRRRPTGWVVWVVLIALTYSMEPVRGWLGDPAFFVMGGLLAAAYVMVAFWPPGKRHPSTVYWPAIAAVVVITGGLLAADAVAPGPFIVVVGLSISAGLLLDHLLLVRTMKAAPEEDDAGAV